MLNNPEKYYLMEPGGHIDCHLSAKVDTMGGLVGLFSKIRSISVTMLVFSFGMSCKLVENIYTFALFFETIIVLRNGYIEESNTLLKKYFHLFYVGHEKLQIFFLKKPFKTFFTEISN